MLINKHRALIFFGSGHYHLPTNFNLVFDEILAIHVNAFSGQRKMSFILNDNKITIREDDPRPV